VRKFSSLIFGAIAVACAAYLSWPMPSEFPTARERGVEIAPRSKVKITYPAADVEAYEVSQPKSVEPSA